MDSADREAHEVELRWALGIALEEYLNATGPEKDTARTRYLELLRKFAHLTIAGIGNW